MLRVYITNIIPDVGIALLRKAGFSISVNDSGKPLLRHELFQVFGAYDAVLSFLTDRIDEEVLEKASSRLKIIANYAVGFDNIDVLFAKRRGIIVTNTPGVAGEAVAEHSFSLILACKKQIVEADKYVRLGKYHKWDASLFLSGQLWGQTIGIIGLGRIGSYVGHIAFGGFKMKILYHDIVRSEDFEMLTEAQFCGIEHLLKEADIITLHTPLTPQTKHLIGKRELEMMKDTAILINTSRGAVIDEKALIWALSEKKIAAAGLDVFEFEPNIPKELTVLANVVVTPHVASATIECRDEMARIAAQNIIDVFNDKEPFGLVRVS